MKGLFLGMVAIMDKNDCVVVKVIQGDYGYGWSDLCEYGKDDLKQLVDDFQSYCDNEPQYKHRIITVVRCCF